MKKSKEHKLKTIADILKVVNKQNLQCFLKDFQDWLCFRITIQEVMTEEMAKQVSVANDDCFKWIDDGKNDAHIKIEIKH